MKYVRDIKKKINDNIIFYRGFVPLTSVIFTVGYLLLLYPESASRSVRSAISLCLDTVIPSLFPFLIVSTLVGEIGVFDALSEKADKLSRSIFGLSGNALPIILMSLIGGYPVGAILICNATEKGKLTQNEARRLMLFCVNPGPSFVISIVGSSLFNSTRIGIFIFISISLSSLLTGVLLRFTMKNTDVYFYCSERKRDSITDTDFSAAVNKAVSGMINICVWIVIFNCLKSLSEIIITNEFLLMFLEMTTEITSAAVFVSSRFSIPVMSAIISFGGFCVHFQILTYLRKIKIRYSLFLTVRMLVSFISALITACLIGLFPDYCSVFSLGSKPTTTESVQSFPVTAFLMLMCGLYIIGDNYILKTKRKNRSRI